MSAAITTAPSFPDADATVRRSRAGRLRGALARDPLGTCGIIVVLAIVVLAVAYPLVVPYNPVTADPGAVQLPPGPAHWFGTDNAGRDVFSRVLAGSRVAIGASVVVLAIAIAVGLAVGSLAGYVGGWADELIMRVTDIFLSFPPLLLAMAVNAGLGAGLFSTMAAIALTWWPSYARMIRGQVLVLKEQSFVEAAHAVGLSHTRIIVRHVIPNILGIVLIQATLDVGYVVLTTSSLSFVGLGSQPPTPDWGAMVADGRGDILNSWWWSTFPGLAICLLATGSNLSGDLLRAALDPRGRSR